METEEKIIITGGEHRGRRGLLATDKDGGTLYAYIGPAVIAIASWEPDVDEDEAIDLAANIREVTRPEATCGGYDDDNPPAVASCSSWPGFDDAADDDEPPDDGPWRKRGGQ